jgi:hypothetical protein
MLLHGGIWTILFDRWILVARCEHVNYLQWTILETETSAGIDLFCPAFKKFVNHALTIDCMIADVLQQGWTVDYASRMLTVKKQPVVTEQKLDPRKLQQLTEYVFHLEHWSF